MKLTDLWPFKAADRLALGEKEPVHPFAESLQSGFQLQFPVEAHIVRGMLEDNGIECVLSNELFAAADGPVANATGGVQVFVRVSDMSQARELMHEAKASEERR